MVYFAQIITYYFQIDLIDMRHRPDGSFKWIGHYMDYRAKFHVLFPLVRKSAAEVTPKDLAFL